MSIYCAVHDTIECIKIVGLGIVGCERGFSAVYMQEGFSAVVCRRTEGLVPKIGAFGGDNVSDSAFGDESSPIAQLVIYSPPIAQWWNPILGYRR